MTIHIGKSSAVKPTRRILHRVGVVYIVLALILAVALLFICSVLIIYVVYFPGNIASRHEVWAQFGTFLGGVLTPAFSFLTFLALLVTIIFQQSELKNSQMSLDLLCQELELTKDTAMKSEEFNKNESERAELFEMIKFVHGEINDLYLHEVDFVANEKLGFFFSGSAPSKSKSAIPKNGDAVTDHDRSILIDLCDYMTELNNYLNHYEGKLGHLH